MPIPVNSNITPRTTGYSVVDDSNIKGGYRTVADSSARDAIPDYDRKAGMAVLTQSDGKLWILGNDLVTWTEFLPGGSDLPFLIANSFPGSDIGAQVNAAMASLPSSGGVVVVLNGNYSLSTQIVMLPNTVLKLPAGVIDCYPIAGVPAILMQDNCSIIGQGDSSQLKEPQFYIPGEYSICIGDYNSWHGSKDPTRDGNHDLTVSNIQFVAQSGGAEIVSTTTATVNFFNVHNAKVIDCYFNGTHSFGICYGGGSTGGFHADRVRVLNCVFEGLWSQNCCAVNANHVIFSGNTFTDTQQVAVTYMDIELNQSIDDGQFFNVSDNIFDINPNTSNSIQPGAAIQITGATPMNADLTQPYLPNSGFGIVSGNIINGGPYPVAELPRLSQGIFVSKLTNINITNNILNNLSNSIIDLRVVRGAKISNNTITNAGSEGACVSLSGCQNCVVSNNHILNENFNYSGMIHDPSVEELQENGDYNLGTPVGSDFNFIYDNDLNFFPALQGASLNQRYPFINTVGPNTKAYNNRLQGKTVDDNALQNITELSLAPYPGTRNSTNPPIARLAGLNSAGDGGGGIWVWDSSSTATADGITVVSCAYPVPSGANGRWIKEANVAVDAISGKVSSIAGLRLSSYHLYVSNVTVSGYYQEGDGGGGDFYWDSSNSNADDGGAYIKPSSVSGNGRWVRLVKGLDLNPLWWGAKDDVTFDSYAAFSAMFSFVDSLYTGLVDPPPGITIRIPAGNFRLTQTLIIDRPLSLDGAGRNCTFLWFLTTYPGPGTPITGITFQKNSDLPGPPAEGADASYGRIRHLTMYGDGNEYTFFHPPDPFINENDPLTAGSSSDGHPYFSGNGVELLCHNVIVEDVYVGGFKFDAFHVEAGDTPNANGWIVRDVFNSSCGRHGLFVSGDNGNAGTASGLDLNGNVGWGVYDRSFLGNHYDGNQVAENGTYVRDILALCPSPQTFRGGLPYSVMAGARQGGVYASADFASWRSFNTGLQNPADTTSDNACRVSCITALCNDGTNFYAGSGAINPGFLGGGVYVQANFTESTSWAQSNSGLTNTDVRALACAGGYILAGTVGGGVYVSSNTASTWTQSNSGLGILDVRAIVSDPGNAGTWFVGTNGGGVYKTTNNGTSWVQVVGGMASTNVLALAMVTGTLYAGCDDGQIYQTTNGGTSWTNVFTMPSASTTLNGTISSSATTIVLTSASGFPIGGGTILIDSEQIAYIPGSISGNTISNVIRGVNGTSAATHNSGTTIALVVNPVQSLTIDPNTNANVYAGTEFGGIYSSINSGSSWTQTNTGMTDPQNNTFPILNIKAMMVGTDGTIYAGVIGYHYNVDLHNNGGIFSSVNTGGGWISAGGNWSNTGSASLRYGGSYAAKGGVNSPATFVGCYAEGDQNVDITDGSSIIIGGILAEEAAGTLPGFQPPLIAASGIRNIPFFGISQPLTVSVPSTETLINVLSGKHLQDTLYSVACGSGASVAILPDPTTVPGLTLTFCKNNTSDGGLSVHGVIAGLYTSPASFVLYNQDDYATLVSDGSKWVIVGERGVFSASVNELLLPYTTLSAFFGHIPVVASNYLLTLYYRVVTGPTDVTFQLAWVSAGGSQTVNVVDQPSQAVGEYSVSYLVNSIADGSSEIVLWVAASVADHIYCSANIKRI